MRTGISFTVSSSQRRRRAAVVNDRDRAQKHIWRAAIVLLSAGLDFDALLADKAFDNDWLRAELDTRGAMAVIPPKADRTRPILCDFAMYRWRRLIENFFCNLKQFRRIATRYEKTDISFRSMIHLVGSVMALK